MVIQKEHNIRQMPLYLKSIEIFKLCSHLCKHTANQAFSSPDKQSTINRYYSDYLISDAVHLTSNLAAAANTNILKLRLHRGERIKKVLDRISAHCDRLEQNSAKEYNYLYSLRCEIKQFRKQFTDWLHKPM